MANVRAGISSLYQWMRIRRGAACTTRTVDKAGLRRSLRAERKDFDALMTEVKENGVAAVPGYWSADKCRTARMAFDRVLAEHQPSVKVYSGGADQRIYGMESADPIFAAFHDDPFLKGFGELDHGLEQYNFATLGGRIEAKSTNVGSGEGWHRDAHGYQFKTILYLTDTSPQNGPFQYVQASHKLWRVAIDTAIGELPEAPNMRYSNADIERVTSRLGLTLRSFPAPAGTLLLVNTSGIHRGMPLESGLRYALTNYYYHPSGIDEARIAQFAPLIPGTAERIRRDLF